MILSHKEIVEWAEKMRATRRSLIERDMKEFNERVIAAYVSGQAGVYLERESYHRIKHDLRAAGYKVDWLSHLFNELLFIRLPRKIEDLN